MWLCSSRSSKWLQTNIKFKHQNDVPIHGVSETKPSIIQKKNMSEHWAPIKHQQHGSTTLHSPRRISRYEMIANGKACQDPAGRPLFFSLGNIAPASKRGKKNMVIQPRSLTVTLVILSPQLSMIPIAAGWTKELGWTNHKHPWDDPVALRIQHCGHRSQQFLCFLCGAVPWRCPDMCRADMWLGLRCLMGPKWAKYGQIVP